MYTRSCEKIAFDTCQTANKVDYCYCMGELCNKYSRPSDDEDTELEGSGQSSNSNTDDGLLLLTDVTRNIMHDVTSSTTQAIPTATRGEVHFSSASASATSYNIHQNLYHMRENNFLLTICIIIYRYVFLQ